MTNISNTCTDKVIKQLKGYNFHCKVEAITKGGHTGINIFIPIGLKIATEFVSKTVQDIGDKN